jgi:hypothetical protein
MQIFQGYCEMFLLLHLLHDQVVMVAWPVAFIYIIDYESGCNIVAGSALLAYGFGAYFALLPGGDVSSILLVYGFPMALLGAALSYAQVRKSEDCLMITDITQAHRTYIRHN